jgi:hypothetical protein
LKRLLEALLIGGVAADQDYNDLARLRRTRWGETAIGLWVVTTIGWPLTLGEQACCVSGEVSVVASALAGLIVATPTVSTKPSPPNIRNTVLRAGKRCMDFIGPFLWRGMRPVSSVALATTRGLPPVMQMCMTEAAEGVSFAP